LGREEKRILTLFFLVVVRYITDRFQPDKAIDLIDEAAAGLRMQQESRAGRIGTRAARFAAVQDGGGVPVQRRNQRQTDRTEEQDCCEGVPSSRTGRRVEHGKEDFAKAEEQEAGVGGCETRAGTGAACWRSDSSRRAQVSNHPSLESDQEGAKTNVVPVCLTAVQEAKTRLLSEAVAEEEIARVVARRTGVAVEAMTQSDRERLRNLEEHLEREVVGQPEAVRAVAACVRRAKVGLNAPGRPLGVFLFAGPTASAKRSSARGACDEREALKVSDLFVVIKFGGKSEKSCSFVLGEKLF
jgi:ATP-dependent Clp protease ATP-binding subunit ClpB